MERYGKKFKELTFKEKVVHFKEYYLWYVVASIIGVCVIGSIIATSLTPSVTYDVDMFMLGQLDYDETEGALDAHFKEKFNTNLDFARANWNNPGEMETGLLQKVPVLLSIQQLDILAVEPIMFNTYASQEFTYLPLEEIPEMAPLLEKYSDRLVCWNQKYNDVGELIPGERHVYGIRVSSLPNITSLTMYNDYVLGITTTVKNIDKTVEFLTYILEGSEISEESLKDLDEFHNALESGQNN